MTASAGRPLRVATLDAQAGRLERPTRRSLLAAGVHHVLTLAAGDVRHFGERAQALRDARPDVVLVPIADRAGADGLPLLSEPLRFGCGPQRPAPRVVLACDDDGGVARAARLLAPFPLDVLPGVRTDEGHRRLVARLRELRRTDGVLRDEALEELARRVAEVRGGPALVVDVSGASTSVVRADGAALLAAHARPLGIGGGADHVVARAGLDRVRRWIPWTVDQPTLLERVFNRARWPGVVPADRESLAVEIALAHEAIAHTLADAEAAGIAAPLRSAATIVLAGALAQLPPAESVLVAVDSLDAHEPAAICRDEGDALVELAAAAIGAGDRAPLDASIRDRVPPVAAVVPVTALRRGVVRIRSSGVAREERVDQGAFYVVSVEGPVMLDGPGVTRDRVTAGPLGLVVDARPRPLVLPARDAERVPAVGRWYEALGALTADPRRAGAATS